MYILYITIMSPAWDAKLDVGLLSHMMNHDDIWWRKKQEGIIEEEL